MIITGDCVEMMREMAPASVDAVVCDPPYGLEFMGKTWDRLGGARIRQPSERDGQPGAAHNGTTSLLARNVPEAYVAGPRMQAWHEAWAREVLRVLKPGGHLLAFGGTRTYHRLVCAVEDAGFEIRDCITWMYGSGFPKSHNLEGEWSGWGTALKPACEPVVVARKPLVGTVAGNVLAHGVGGLNIDGCRIEGGERPLIIGHGEDSAGKTTYGSNGPGGGSHHAGGTTAGRWPANVVLSHSEDCVQVGTLEVRADGHFPAARGVSGYGSGIAESNGGGLHGQDELAERSFDGELVERWACVPGCAVRLLDDQAGERTSGANPTSRNSDKFRTAYGEFEGQREIAPNRGAERGGASRFYYCAKAGREERNAGIGGSEAPLLSMGATPQNAEDADWPARNGNHHPTVKPIDLMRWLIRLVTPPGGTVLDPFTGSGTTGCAAVLEGFEFVGIEREAEYVAIAEARIGFWREHPTGLPVEVALQREAKRRQVRESGQLGFGI